MLLALGMVLGVAGIQFDSDVSDALRNQVNGDLQFVQQVQGLNQSPFHREVFGNVDGNNYISWFVNRVKYFGVDSCGGAGAVACVNSSNPSKVYVTNNYIYANHPQIARLMTLFHEARHTEVDKDMWPHAKCPRNYAYRSIWTGAKLANKHACDVTPFGSYGSASIMLNNISKFCANCTDKVKIDAQIYSDDQSKRIVDLDAYKALKTDFRYE